MSAKRKRMSNKPPSQPLVRIDENGKVWALPVNWNKELPEHDTSDKGAASITKPDVKRRKFIPILPIEKLNPTPYIYEDSPFSAPKKSQGIDNKCIRKELFKKPDNRKTLMKRPDATGAAKYTTVKNLPTNDIPPGTPLMELEQAEKLIEDKPQRTKPPFPFKPVEKPLMKFGVRNMTTPSRTREFKLETVTEVETPGSKESNTSNREFLALEEQCCSSAETKSPLTNVCNLLLNTRLNRNTPEDKPKTKSSPSSVAAKVEQMFEKWTERLDVVKKLHEEDLKRIGELHSERLAELQKQQAQDMMVIRKLLQTPSSSSHRSSSEKENRRSTRIAEQAVSPVISKSADLRKSTLKKNLSKNIESDGSPRLKKAVDLYNDIRGNCSILCTPRMSRKEMISPGSRVKNSLSRRIQEQCLLLQETPR